MAWECRGVSANLKRELETSQKAWLVAGRLEKRCRSEHIWFISCSVNNHLMLKL